MKTHVEYIFKTSQKNLLAQYTSKDFYQNRFEQEELDSTITRFEQKGANTLIEIERQAEIRTDKLPGMLKKVVDKLVGNSASIITTVKWNSDNASGSHVIQAKGVPVRANINFKLLEKSADQCLAKVELDISASIPVVGKQLEKFMLPKAEKALKNDLEKTAQYLQSL